MIYSRANMRITSGSSKKVRFLLGLALMTACVLRAQSVSDVSSRPVLLVAPFEAGEGVLPGEAATLRDLVVSYLDTYQFFRVVDIRAGGGASAREQDAYRLSGRIGRQDSRYILTLALVRSTDILQKHAETYDSINLLMLQYRDFVRAFMEKVAPNAQSQFGFAERGGAEQADGHRSVATISLRDTVGIEDIAGVWQGDKGVSTVRIQRDGRATAGFPGAVMKLKVELAGNAVTISQDQPNAPEFYLSPTISYSLARLIARKARQMRWQFRLSADGTTLIGTKDTSIVNISDNTLVSVDNTYTRTAIWTRLR